MNLLISFNFGDFTHPNVRASHAHAAGRWGAHYLELTAPTWSDRPASQVFGVKLDLHRFPYPPGCRVALIDGDCIIRSDCPSLFDLVPRESMGVVANNQGEEYEAEADDMALSWWKAVTGMMNSLLPYESARYFNGGVMVYTPEVHNDVWRLAELTCRVAQPGRRRVGFEKPNDVPPLMEQTGMNVACGMLGVPLHYLPATFNRMGPRAWTCKGGMEDYILHLANIGVLRGNKAEALGGIDWRCGVREMARSST